MPTKALAVVDSIIGAAGIALAIWSILDTDRENQRRKGGVGGESLNCLHIS